MATMPYTPDSPTIPVPAVDADQSVADTILMTLRAHESDRPNGFRELEIMQIHPTLKLLALRKAVQTLADEGKVEMIFESGSKSRIKLR